MNEFSQSVVKFIGRILSYLPVRIQFFVGDVIAFIWFDVLRIRRKIALQNLKLAFPELSDQQRCHLARESMQNIGRTLIEYPKMTLLTQANVRQTFDIEGEEHLRAAIQSGGGAILLTLHLGNGDYAVSALSQMGYPMHLITKEFRSKWLNDFWFGLRQKLGTKLIGARKTSYEILKALKGNGVVAFVLDQHMGPPLGVKTKFFGQNVGTAVGLAVIVARTRVPVLGAYTVRRSDGRGLIVITPPIPWVDDADYDKTLQSMTQRYNDELEKFVRLYPGQWMWIHKRFKGFREG